MLDPKGKKANSKANRESKKINTESIFGKTSDKLPNNKAVSNAKF
jgi:hypothetical protein